MIAQWLSRRSRLSTRIVSQTPTEEVVDLENEPMNDAISLLEDSLRWLRDSYSTHLFFLERDVVWTVQKHVAQLIDQRNLPYRVFNDHPIVPGPRRSLTVDLAIIDPENTIDVAAEFKYEPSHSRITTNIWPSKLKPSVVFWGKEGVGADIVRVQQFATEGRATVAYSIFIDEGGYFHDRFPKPHSFSDWVEWGNGVWVLYCRAAAGAHGKTAQT